MGNMSYAVMLWSCCPHEPRSATPEHCEPTASLPEYEDEEHQEHAECGYVVHSLHQHHKLAAQRRHETHQLQHPEESERPQHREAPVCLANDLPDAVVQRGTGSTRDKTKDKWPNRRKQGKTMLSLHLGFGSTKGWERKSVWARQKYVPWACPYVLKAAFRP